MKQIVCFAAFAVLCSLRLSAQEPSEQLVPDARVFDFGEIREADGKVSHTFTFTNTSDSLAFINGIHSGCGCVSAGYTREPIRPKKTGTVTVSYNPAYRPGFFSKEIVVLSNNNTRYNRVWIKGRVIPGKHPVADTYPYEYGNGLWMNLEVLAFGLMKAGVPETIKLKYTNDTGRVMRLGFVVEGGNADIWFAHPQRLEPREEVVMPVTFRCLDAFAGEREVNIYPVVNGQKLSKPLVVRCRTKEEN